MDRDSRFNRPGGNRFGSGMGNGSRGPRKPIPVKEGDIVDVEIEGIGAKGDGIAKVQGYVVIVPNVKKGDRLKVKINAVRGKVSFGEAIGEGSPSASKEPTSEEAEEENLEEAMEDEENVGDEEMGSDEQSEEEK